MRRIREVPRLRVALGDNVSAIAAGARLARSSVRKYLARAEAAGIDAAVAEGMTDDALEAALFPAKPAPGARSGPDWVAIDEDLRRHRHVTLKLVQFFSLPELSRAIRDLMTDLNDKPLSAPRAGSRRSLFEAIERTALRPLPGESYTIGEWKIERTVNRDYHIALDRNYYSVPYAWSVRRSMSS